MRWFPTATALLLVLAGCATSPGAQTLDEDPARLERTLVALNERVLVEYVLRNNTGPLEEVALDDFFVVGPAGVELRAHVIATVGSLDVDSVSVETAEVRVYDSTAVLAGTMRAHGQLGGRPMPTLSYLSVFVRQGGKWRLAARSLTPLLSEPPRR
jgi:hypothetical protein